MPTTPRVNVRNQIGFGGAQVYGDTSLDLSQTGAAVVRDSDQYKTKQRAAKGQEIYEGIDPNFDGFVPDQIAVTKAKIQDVQAYAYDPEAQKDPNYLQNLTQKANELNTFVAEQASAAKYNKQKLSSIGTKPSTDFGQEAYGQYQSMFQAGGLKDVAPEDMAAEIVTRAGAVSEVDRGDIDNLIDDKYATSEFWKTTEAGGTTSKSSSVVLSDAGKEAFKQDIDIAFRAALNGKLGFSDVRDPDAEKLYDMANQRIMEDSKHKRKFASLGDNEEAKQGYIKDVMEEIMLDRAKSKSGVGSEIGSEPSKGDSKWGDLPDPNKIEFSREKATVNAEGVVMGSQTMPMGKAPKREKVEVSVGTDSGGEPIIVTAETSKFGIKDGEPIVRVAYKTKSSGEEGEPTSTTKIKDIPYDQIKGSINTEWYDTAFEAMRKKGVTDETEGWPKEKADRLVKKTKELDEGSTFNDKEAKNLIRSVFGASATDIKDPAFPNDLSFEINGQNKKYNMANQSEREDFYSFILSEIERKKEGGSSKKEESNQSAEVIDEDFLKEIGGEVRK